MSTTNNTRRYDIDWLRVIAIGLLLIYHIGIVFQPWGVFIGFIQNDKPIKSLWIPMSLLNVWRIPILFFVSGMGVCFAMKRRNWKQLIIERSRRILLPFIFGICCIVPWHILLWQQYYNQDLQLVFERSHLWFLGNIFLYVLILLPIFYSLKKLETTDLAKRIKKIMDGPIGLLLIIAFFVLETIFIQPESFEMYAMTYHGFVLGGIAFFFGFMVIYSQQQFWIRLQKFRWLLFLLALSLFLVRYLVFDLMNPNYMKAIESCFWIYTVFGFTSKYLNKSSKSLRYLSEGAYPIYILHMAFLYLGSSLIISFSLPPFVKFIMILVFTLAGCFLTYEIIRRVSFLRPLFGLKKRKSG